MFNSCYALIRSHDWISCVGYALKSYRCTAEAHGWHVLRNILSNELELFALGLAQLISFSHK